MDRNNKHNQEDDDPYSSLLEQDDSKLKPPQVESARQRKWRKFREQGGQMQMLAQQGFIMGSLVGGSFGFIIGCYQAVQSRRLIVIPISTIMSGASFGFFMACGSMIRSDEKKNYILSPVQNEEQNMNQLYWKAKYGINE